VPFCAAARVAMTVVLARCSGPDWVRSAAPTAPAAESCSMRFAASADGLRGRVAPGHCCPGAPSEPACGFHRQFWRLGMQSGVKASYDCIKQFSETDFTEDLKKIDVPALFMHGEDDQIVPYQDSSVLAAKLVQNGTLKIYPGFSHGMAITEAETINADLLAFIKS
jgi:pimeloyl-ACP methyl ester carboxylesterase